MTLPRVYSVSFRPLAESDLAKLYEYVTGVAGMERAAAWLRRLEDACMDLEIFPERGTVRSDLYPGLRIIGFERRVSITFVVERDTVRILRLFYAGRDYQDVSWDDDV